MGWNISVGWFWPKLWLFLGDRVKFEKIRNTEILLFLTESKYQEHAFILNFVKKKVLHLWKNNFCSCFSPKMSWKNETFLPEFKLKACSQYLLSVKNSNISVFLIFSNFTLSPKNSHNFGQNQPTEMFHPSLESWDQGQ